MSEDPEQLVRSLIAAEHRAAVWCACQCARTVLHLIPEDPRPGKAIETAEAWVRDEATREDCARAAEDVADAVTAADAAADATAESAVYAVSQAVDAAYAAICAVTDADAAESAVYAVTTAAVFCVDPNDATAYYVNRAELHTLICAIRWPLTTPAFEQLRAAPESIRVAWDLVANDNRTEHLIPELLEAHARAERLGLEWADPVQRAIAERVGDEDRIRALFEAGA